MHKAVLIRVLLWIEGEDEPAHNFLETAKTTVSDIIRKGSEKHSPLKITVKKITEYRAEEDDLIEDEGDEF